MEMQIYDGAEVGEANHHACNRTHGTVEDLLSLVPCPAADKDTGDPFLTLSPRWQKRGSRSSPRAGAWHLAATASDPSRPELTEGSHIALTAMDGCRSGIRDGREPGHGRQTLQDWSKAAGCGGKIP